jgi:HAD superfamily hydrolase (TIGR01484 family)
VILPRPLATADFNAVQAVFTDVDGTLTTAHRLLPSTIHALGQLQASGIPVILVTGRPAGWGECWARTLPVEGVIVENGALYFARKGNGPLVKVYAQAEPVRRRNRKRLVAAVQAALREVPGARLSMDSLYTEVDLAIDYNEEAHLGSEAAHVLEGFLRKRKIQAVRSSVHVNCWIGAFDKLTAVQSYLRRQWKTRLTAEDSRFVYAGDSFNDAPLFKAFALSVGVANVKDVLNQIDPPPRFITRRREGLGFEEIAEAILAAKPKRRQDSR